MDEPAIVTVTMPDGTEVSVEVVVESALTIIALLTGWKVEPGFSDVYLCPSCGTRIKVELKMDGV